jgi:hypothetical protein
MGIADRVTAIAGKDARSTNVMQMYPTRSAGAGSMTIDGGPAWI